MEAILNTIGLTKFDLKDIFAPLVNFGLHIHDHFIPHPRNNYHPHILGHRALGLFSALLVSVKIFTIVVMAFGPVAPAFSSAINISNIINLTNESRQQFGLNALTENTQLNQAAQAKADDMLAKGYFAHNSPDGKTPWDFIVASGYSYLQAGENLAVNFSEAEDVETAWMNSPGHRANLLNKNFQEIGIGVAQGSYQGHNAIFVVQEFGDPAAQKITLASKPTEVKQESDIAPSPTVETDPSLAEAKTEQLKITKPQTQAQPVIPEIRGDKSEPNQKPESLTKPVDVSASDLAATAQAVVEPIKVESGNVNLEDNKVVFNAVVSTSAVKVLAYFGGQAVMLEPKEGNVWQAKVLASELTKKTSAVRINAFDINGNSATLNLAEFSPDTVSNYNLAGTQAKSSVSFMGFNFDPKNLENRFYLLFIAGLLTSLIIAIGVKRHIQHLPLIANSSFVVMFASLLLWMG